jgi:hypothetical protein
MKKDDKVPDGIRERFAQENIDKRKKRIEKSPSGQEAAQ